MAKEVSAQPFPREQVDFFEKEIRPVLVESCQDCHGAHRHENGLRLDLRSALIRGSDYGAVVKEGAPEASKLIQAIKHAPGVEPMPRKADPLTPLQVQKFEQWIAMGLPWPEEHDVAATGHAKPKPEEHWAFQPVRDPVPPKVATKTHSSVDAFVAAELQAAGLDFAPAAEADDLCRRLHLTLTGLQPSFEDLRAFEAAHSRDPKRAISRLTSQLLASPQYGMRWARHWLDVARYSDTEGYTAGGRDNRFAHAYSYRNWVIEALNADMPYDEFVRNQLAADKLIPSPDLIQTSLSTAPTNAAPEVKNLAALGFLTVNDRFLGDTVLQTDDRIDVVGRGLLGLTIGCARCHDHKYDPIPSRDYYALYGVFGSSEVPAEPDMPIIGQPDNEVVVTQFRNSVSQVEEKMAKFRREVHQDLRDPEKIRDYLLFANKHLNAESAAFRGTAGKEKMRDRIADRWRNFFKAYAVADKPHPVLRAWKMLSGIPEAEFAARAPAALEALAKQPQSTCNQVVSQTLSRLKPRSLSDVAHIYGEIFVTHLSEQPFGDPQKDSIRSLVRGGNSPMGIEADAVDRYFTRKDAAQMTKFRNELKGLEMSAAGAPYRAMAMRDRAQPRDQKIMIRGNKARLGDSVPRGYLSFFGGKKFESGSGRLELANLIASRDNPLTARVIVNRVWMHHFGKPLVSQPSDFGVQTPKPVHADLLDHLATTFMREGWSLKKLHRRILTSRTWQQSSETTPLKREKDADNELLSRMNRRRVAYEVLRDNLLLVSGSLDPARRPERSIPLDAADADAWRSVLLFVDRYNQPTVPAMFDFANPDTHSPQRFVTTVPQQALFLMNSPFMKIQSERLAAGAPVQGSTPDSETIRSLYRRVLLRDATPQEVELAQRFLVEASQLQAGPAYVWKYGTVRLRGDAQPSDWLEFKHFNDKSKLWSHTGKIPDPEWTYASFGQSTGHTGPRDIAPSLRWTAPTDAVIQAQGFVDRHQDQGNGVRLHLFHSRTGKIASLDALPKQKVPIDWPSIEVRRGDTLTFAFDAIDGNTSFDSFRWALSLHEGDQLLTDAKADFCGPDHWPIDNRPRPQSPLAQFAQVLMMSNEFQFID